MVNLDASGMKYVQVTTNENNRFIYLRYRLFTLENN